MLFLFFQVSEDNKKVRRVTTKPLPEETAEARYDAKTKTVYCVSCVKHAVQLYSVIGVTLKPYNSKIVSQFQNASQIYQGGGGGFYLLLEDHLCTPSYTSIQQAALLPTFIYNATLKLMLSQ